MGLGGHVVSVKLLYCLIVLHYVYNRFTLSGPRALNIYKRCLVCLFAYLFMCNKENTYISTL